MEAAAMIQAMAAEIERLKPKEGEQ